jgi:hypothetical protein
LSRIIPDEGRNRERTYVAVIDEDGRVAVEGGAMHSLDVRGAMGWPIFF